MNILEGKSKFVAQIHTAYTLPFSFKWSRSRSLNIEMVPYVKIRLRFFATFFFNYAARVPNKSTTLLGLSKKLYTLRVL